MVYTFRGPFIQKFPRGCRDKFVVAFFLLQLKKSKTSKIKGQTFKDAF